MKRLFKITQIVLSVILAFSLCACHAAEQASVSSSDTVSHPAAVSDEERVKTYMEAYLKNTYGDALAEIVFHEVKVYTREEIASMEVFEGDVSFAEKDIVFGMIYDLRGYTEADAYTLSIPNGEEDGLWARDKYSCGFLKYIAENQYELSEGSAF